MAETLEQTVQKLEKAVNLLSEFSAAGNRTDFGQSFGKNSETLTRFVSILSTSSEAMKSLGSVFESTASNLGPLGRMVGGFGDGIANLGSTLTQMSGALADMGVKAIQAFDAPSKYIRVMEREMFDLDKRFAESSERASEFQKTFEFETTTKFAESLLLTADSLREIVQYSKNTSLNLDQLNETVTVGTESISLYSATAGIAAATGMGVARTTETLNTLMNIQGLTSQEAVNAMGMYIAVSDKTGLTIEDVATNLNSAISGFSKLGMTADFGRPALEGFAKTIKDMGLGIEQSTGLAQTLTSTLGGLATNYANAYLVFQRGGLEMSSLSAGGGMLGASIGIRAALLEAQKSGPEAQSEISRQLMTGLRDTIASFGGGEIVTLQEAAESPGLQNQYYIQQQMLKSQFNISDDASADRVLDLLAQLEEATASGNNTNADALVKQIQQEAQNRDTTMDAAEKLERKLDMQIAIARVGYRELLLQGNQMANLFASGTGKVLEEGVFGGSTEENRKKLLERLRADAEKSLDTSQFSSEYIQQALSVLSQPESASQPGTTGGTINAGTTGGGAPDVTATRDGIMVGNVKITFDLTENARGILEVANSIRRIEDQSSNGTVGQSRAP